jgi:PPOX class probable F420-dependent enzyme
MTDISLSDDELWRLLSSEIIGVLATVNPDGRPHAVPIWTIPLGKELYVGTYRTSRKARNLARSPAFTLVVGLGPWGPSAVLSGVASEVKDRGLQNRLYELSAARYYGSTAHPSYINIERRRSEIGGGILFRLEIERVTSWSYEKLAADDWILPWAPGARGVITGRCSRSTKEAAVDHVD